MFNQRDCLVNRAPGREGGPEEVWTASQKAASDWSDAFPPLMLAGPQVLLGDSFQLSARACV